MSAVPPRLALAGITKRFGAVVANDDISFSVAPGEIHALVGENGAGKSTLVKIIYGLLRPDAGVIRWNGETVAPTDPHAARRLGIGMVFQHFSLFDAFTVAENIALGLDAAGDRRALAARIASVSASYGLPLEPGRAVGTLSMGERQRVEIVRCLLQNPRLLVMDEPTSVLTPQEAEVLFATLRRLAAEGCSILYISHKLDEIRALCQRATILRAGRVVANCNPAVETARSMAEMMIGNELRVTKRMPSDRAPEKPARLSVNGLDRPAERAFGVALRDIRFSVGPGEIFGIAGVAGNGQGELMEALSGEWRTSAAAAIAVDGAPVADRGPQARRLAGLYTLPEERNGHAAVPGMSLAANTLLSARHHMGLTRAGVIRRDAARRFAQRIVSAFDVRTFGVDVPASSLSGGNLQKFVVGRELLQKPAVLVVAQPTWGVDAGAAAAIHIALADLAREGAAIVVISQDLDELLSLTDRIAVISGGRLSRTLQTAQVTVDEIGLLMGGAEGETRDAA
ncbi:simple sugar transport system ATP-binding protein [Pseudochelatococcus lubricantis]|uniref:Simple sugar transport system ATP-binding protein n=1 Tax=Pseudochelatococcus lubricantis TaxID=1538102 RepID=A0ABX0UY35_9HYPH|nr:ABC transporter ATP-binding protein [Pseudochelatococcus lubricantis]NIJ57858.1 simple sugar transport system ATP-binding protein [Pseudochelatococcus lubricantis]